MIKMMVEFVWQKEKLVSASFTRIQFWIETLKGYLVDSKDANGADLPDLRFWLERLQGGIFELLEIEK